MAIHAFVWTYVCICSQSFSIVIYSNGNLIIQSDREDMRLYSFLSWINLRSELISTQKKDKELEM